MSQPAFDERAFFRQLPVLVSSELRLRPLRLEDAPDIFAYSQDPSVSQHVLWNTHHQLSDAVSFVKSILRKYEAGEVAEWGIELKREAIIVGTCGYVNFYAEHRRAEVGYALARRLWGRGLASEALMAVVGYSFRTLGLNRIEARVTVDNLSSIRVLERAGFRREGLMARQLWFKGMYHDVLHYGLLRPEALGL